MKVIYMLERKKYISLYLFKFLSHTLVTKDRLATTTIKSIQIHLVEVLCDKGIFIMKTQRSG